MGYADNISTGGRFALPAPTHRESSCVVPWRHNDVWDEGMLEDIDDEAGNAAEENSRSPSERRAGLLACLE